nr:hypothetical protein [Mesorhizobium sp. M8A.F.Ca.ET.142.01.1.1]
MARQLTMHGLDDVAALADTAQRRFELIIETPGVSADFLRQTHALELAQAALVQRLAKGVATVRRDKPFIIAHAEQSAVDAGEALLLHFWRSRCSIS